MMQERREQKRLTPEKSEGDSGAFTVVLTLPWGSTQAEPRADAAKPAEGTRGPPEG